MGTDSRTIAQLNTNWQLTRTDKPPVRQASRATQIRTCDPNTDRRDTSDLKAHNRFPAVFENSDAFIE